MAKPPIDSELVRSLATLLDETNLTEIEYEAQGLRIRVARQQQVANLAYQAPAAAPAAALPAAVPAAAASDDPANHPGCLKSPMVGVVYFSPEPGAAAFVHVGDTVQEGQTLLLIEAMKTFNPIRAQRAGKVQAILVEDGQPVEYGEALIVVA